MGKPVRKLRRFHRRGKGTVQSTKGKGKAAAQDLMLKALGNHITPGNDRLNCVHEPRQCPEMPQRFESTEPKRMQPSQS